MAFLAGLAVAAGLSGDALAQEGRPLTIVVLGDSLAAGYGLSRAAAFPETLERALRARGHDVRMVNAGVSGDTSTGGLERLDWSVPEGTDGVIVELGANDMLRGVEPAVTRQALEAIVKRLKARGIPVMLAGMRASRNLGPAYTEQFDAIYRDLAAKYGLVLYPFFLEGVAGDRALNLPDGIHPTAGGVERIVESILPSVEGFVRRLKARVGDAREPRRLLIASPAGLPGRPSPSHAVALRVSSGGLPMPRLFTGLEIPADIGRELSSYRGGLPGARWIDPENYHITLRFIGDVDHSVAREIFSLLGEGRRREPVTVTIDGLASFGGERPRAVFARAVPTNGLAELQSEQERIVRRAGLPPEKRKFLPHVTLARLRDSSPIDVAGYIATRGQFPKLTFTARRFVLFSARDSVGGGPYVVEAAYPLG